MRQAEAALPPLLRWDKDVSYLCYRWYNTYVQNRVPLLILEVSGHGVPWLLVPTLIFVLQHNLSPSTSSFILNLLAVTVLDLAVIGILKPLFGRKRPAYNSGIGQITIHAVDQFSFPSGHATRAGLVAAFVWDIQHRHPDGLYPFFACSAFFVFIALWAAMICVSRVALGRHHVLDVVCGVLLGIAYVYAWDQFWISPQFSQHLRNSLRHALLGSASVVKAATVLESTV